MWKEAIARCSSEEECRRALEEFFSRMCPDRSMCEEAGGERHAWIARLIEGGAEDGRARLILYVISRYLMNVRRMSEEEAMREIEVFLERSCKNYGRCEKIYASWIRSVLRGVRQRGLMPWSPARIRERDPQLYEVIKRYLGAAEG